MPDSVHGQTGTLYMVCEFEANAAATTPRIYMGKSTDAGQTWSGWTKVSHDDTLNYHDPSVVVSGSTVHLYYVQVTNIGNYLGKLWHRTCTLSDFITGSPTWSAAEIVIDGGPGAADGRGWGPQNTAETDRIGTAIIFPYGGKWWLIAITGDDARWHIYWSATLTSDWWNANYVGKLLDTGGSEPTPSAPYLAGAFGWPGIANHPRVTILGDGTLLLTCSVSPPGGNTQTSTQIGAAILTPSTSIGGFGLNWVQFGGPTFGTQSGNSHCCHVVNHGGAWVCVYDRTQWTIRLANGVRTP